MDLGLERVVKVAGRCGLLPATCPVILVAGTNGKGSTVSFLDAMLGRGGLRVGSYTSPHLHNYNERIRINGEVVGDEVICGAFDFIERRRGDCALTFFEYGTLAALKCFMEAGVDVMVLEVGLGGRLDAVNITEPVASVVTNIGFDHMQWLGRDRESIAFEKLGVARKGRPLISGDPSPPEIIAGRAAELGARLFQYGEQFACESGEDGWRFTFQGRTMQLPLPGLFGDMQLRNASCAIAVLCALNDAGDGLRVDAAAIAEGVRAAHIEGRFQRTDAAGGVIYDIAHNVEGARELRKNLERAVAGARTQAVCGVLKDKDAVGMLEAMKEVVTRWYLAPPDNERCLGRDALEDAAQKAGLKNFRVCASVPDACAEAVKNREGGDCLTVFGSVFTVAEAQRSLRPE